LDYLPTILTDSLLWARSQHYWILLWPFGVRGFYSAYLYFC